ncbi:MAG: protein-glutamate O-methyltransferase CheR [Calditrichia bacterium]|nr:protein-glutamate O-methyltransferase CheR [Calditrichia bacterium]
MNNENIEIQLFLEAIYLKYGYDFRNYSKASIKRRLEQRLLRSGLPNISSMQYKILHDKSFFETLFLDLSINVTEMFRDPLFYTAIRKSVLPILKTYPYIKIWHAGCSTGEEVYSMAILLKEEGLLDKVLIYATDVNENVLKKAKEGIYPIDQIKEYTTNYQMSGGKASFADYYVAKYDAAIMDQSLKKNLVFSQHNLATDSVFGEMHMIICRNVLIYFNKELQNSVISLFNESLIRKGLLCLGSKESLRFSNYVNHFSELVTEQKIYQKKLLENC